MANGGAQPTGNIDDVIAQLRELVELAKVSQDAQKATHHILQNPDLKSGGPYTQAGRWWERQKTWKDFFKSSTRRGRRIGGAVGRNVGRIGGSAGMRVGGAVGGATGYVAGAAVVVATAFREAVKAVDGWTEKALESARKLSEVSGSMAAVVAEKDILQMQRDFARGEATAATTKALVESQDRRQRATQDMSIMFDNVQNMVLTGLNDLLTEILKPISDAVVSIAEFFGYEKPAAPGPAGIAADFERMRKAAERIDKAGRNLMDIARDAAARHSGVAAPAGAAPPGMAPGFPPL